MTRRTDRAILGTGIGALLAAMLFGPIWSPPEFHWIQHTTSEQAGQQMSGAWMMRAGFIGYGVSVMAAMALARAVPIGVRLALALFGLGLLGAALWSNLPVIPELAGDVQEDWLHSAASNVVGTGFAMACAARLFLPGGSPRDAMAWAGLLISILIPIAMGTFPEVRGLPQRLMFLFSAVYIWRETRRA